MKNKHWCLWSQLNFPSRISSTDAVLSKGATKSPCSVVFEQLLRWPFLCINKAVWAAISRDDWSRLASDLLSSACWLLASQIKTRGRVFFFFNYFLTSAFRAAPRALHPLTSPRYQPPFPLSSVAQQPSVINELLQFDLICLRIGHVR